MMQRKITNVLKLQLEIHENAGHLDADLADMIVQMILDVVSDNKCNARGSHELLRIIEIDHDLPNSTTENPFT